MSVERMEGGIVIVGAGECGTRTALSLREMGYDGRIRLLGAERHFPYERPPLSKSVLADGSASPPTIADGPRLAAAGISFSSGAQVTQIDRRNRRIVLGDASAVSYGKLLLATGARARTLDLDGAPVPGLTYLRTLDDCLALRSRLEGGSRLVIIGGGFLGLEAAAAARARNVAVTLIETQSRILMRGVPEQVAAVLAARHAEAGVRIYCGAGLASISAGAAGGRVVLADGSSLEADTILASIGAIPNTELAAAAGLTVQNGVLVDTYLTTSDARIFAAGDCCAFPLASANGSAVRLESWRNVVDQATVVAANLLGRRVPYDAVPWFWSDQYELTLQVAGVIEPGLAVVRRDLGGGAFVLFHLDKAGGLRAVSGIGPAGAIARDVRLSEMLIARGARPDPELLARPDAKLKAMLAA